MKKFPFRQLPLQKISNALELELGGLNKVSRTSNVLPTQFHQGGLESSSNQSVLPSNFEDIEASEIENLHMIWGAVKEVGLNTQAPGRMVVLSAMTSFVTVVQGLYQIRSPVGSLHPLSLNTIIVAPSGMRKSTVDRFFTMVIHVLIRIVNEEIQQLNQEVESQLEKWELDNKLLRAAYTRAKKKGTADLEEEALSRHQELKPQVLNFLTMVHDDFTLSALQESLYSNMPVASIMSCEGAKILNEANIRSVPFFNKTWGREDVQVSRITRESFWLKDVALSTSLMIQPDVLKKILDKRQEELRGSGYLARALTCFPKNNIGQRPIHTTKKYTEKTNILNARLGELCIELFKSLADPGFERTELALDQEAEQVWLAFANDVENKMKPGEFLNVATDLGSKLAEQALRVSGVMHAVEYGDGPISANTMRIAISICKKCAEDFLEYFVPPPQDAANGQKLYKYLYTNYIVYQRNRPVGQILFDERFIRKNRVLQCGPLSNAEKMMQGLGYLVRQGIVQVVEELRPKGRGIVYIDLQPHAPLPYYSINGHPLRCVPIN